MTKILLIMAGGALGTLARFALAHLVQRHAPESFPWGTFVVNMCGCFLFGLVWSVAEGRWAPMSEMRATVLVGFMGAFTTFSTFAFESGELFREGEWVMAFANVAGQTILGIGLLFVGMALGRQF